MARGGDLEGANILYGTMDLSVSTDCKDSDTATKGGVGEGRKTADGGGGPRS